MVIGNEVALENLCDDLQIFMTSRRWNLNQLIVEVVLRLRKVKNPKPKNDMADIVDAIDAIVGPIQDGNEHAFQ